ncbi:MAG: Wzy polymerase domain-containing protein [Rubrivivax sp.]
MCLARAMGGTIDRYAITGAAKQAPISVTPRTALAIAAAAAPSLLAFNVSPSSTFLNQALALVLWGWFVAMAAPPAVALPARLGRWGAGSLAGVAPVGAALALVALSVGWSWGPGALPHSLALSALGLLAGAGLLLASGAVAHAPGPRDAASVWADFCIGWAVAGALNVVVAAVQVFAPTWPDGDWLAISGIPGRAVGNLRQPNHLSSLRVWSAIAVVALLQAAPVLGASLRQRWGVRAGMVLFAALIGAVVLTASRTGTLSVLLLALWGLLDRRLAGRVRLLLLAAPLLYGLAWWGMAEWAALSHARFGGTARLAEADVSGSRFAIWRDTLGLIALHPWTGVGFGEFNFAWSLTAFPQRPIAFFDHTHNLPLQLAVELGLPLATAVMVLLGWGLWRAAAAAWADTSAAGTGRRAAGVMVLMIGLHSLLEYPLWYAYFLLPAAWAWGFTAGRPATAPAAAADGPDPGAAPSPRWVVAGVALALGGLLSVMDYQRVTAIFMATEGGPTLAERITAGQRSLFFAHHADYAAATTGQAPADDALAPFDGATHFLLDTRLMVAWARALAEQGQLDRARAIAQRLREFRNAGSAEFFAECGPGPAPNPATAAPAAPAASAAALPFQCTAPQAPVHWRDYIRH